MSAADKLTLPRRRRLKLGRDFAQLRTAGQRLASGCLIMNWLALSPGAPSRLGVVTSRKVGNAVVRNRGRRLLREAYRLHQRELNRAVDMVLVARPSLAGKTFLQVEQDYLTALRRARLRKEAQ
jgi:ribonuclease P protein component